MLRTARGGSWRVIAGQLGVDLGLRPVGGGGGVAVAGRRRPVMGSVSAILVAGAPIHRRVSPNVGGGVQRLAQIPPGWFRGSDGHHSVDQRLLEHGGGIQGGTPQLLTLGSRVDAKLVCPQSVSDRLVPLPRPFPTLVCQLITSVGSNVTVRSAQGPSFDDVIALGSVSVGFMS